LGWIDWGYVGDGLGWFGSTHYILGLGQAGTSTCSTDLFRLLPCLPFIEGTAAVPADTCCANLGSMVHDEPQCLCQALSNPSTAPVAVNMTRVMAMPRLCRLDLPPATGACAGKVLPFEHRVPCLSHRSRTHAISITRLLAHFAFFSLRARDFNPTEKVCI
jgi:hypothetical protein